MMESRRESLSYNICETKPARTGKSTRAFDVTLRAYDLNLTDSVNDLIEAANQLRIDAQYKQKNVLEIEIEETDLLFIDTLHRYEQLAEELRLHAKKAKKYLILHDTQTYGTLEEQVDGMGSSIGLLPAMIHYLIENPGVWEFKIHSVNNNDLTVLERVG